MTEYQYYEFQALDRPLTQDEMRELRACSSRATITSTRFVNHYDFGSFKGDPSKWMEKYFDAFLYLANWGTHELMLRWPRRVLGLEIAKKYFCGRSASARVQGDFLIFELLSEEEGGDWGSDLDEGSGSLSSLIPIRADLAAGDHRALYLAWLLCVQSDELDDSATEPPVPAGLGDLTAPLTAFADFLRIDGDLIAAAAARSAKAQASAAGPDIERWIRSLPEADKTGWLVRLAEGDEPHLRAELLRELRESHPIRPSDEAPRTVGDLLEAAEQMRDERQRKEAERAAAERTRREKEEVESRNRYLDALAKREDKGWSQVDALIATKQPARYDEAVKLLRDLRDLAVRDRRSSEADARLRRLREEHSKKPTFIERLKKAGLG